MLIVGGGPTGVYAGAERLSALVTEDVAIGGQAGTSSRIENYMGFPTGISGGHLEWRSCTLTGRSIPATEYRGQRGALERASLGPKRGSSRAVQADW